MTAPVKVLLYLIRTAFGLPGESPDLPSLTAGDWKQVIDFAFRHGVEAISMDGLQKHISSHEGEVLTLGSPDILNDRYEWLLSPGRTASRYAQYYRKLTSLCRLYTDNGFEPILLKGAGLGENYPIPEHRTTGDIDLFVARRRPDGTLAGASLESDLMIGEKLGVTVTKSIREHHSCFTYGGLLVENHYEPGNTYFRDRRSQNLEELLEDLVLRDTWKPFEGFPCLVPSADFNAVFLMWHLGCHFTTGEMGLRQLSDWLLFLARNHGRTDWSAAGQAWKDAGMERFADAVGTLLVKYFGMPGDWMPISRPDEKSAGRILDDLFGAFVGDDEVPSPPERYVRYGWKYTLVSGHHWIRTLAAKIWLHLAHRGDLERKEVK